MINVYATLEDENANKYVGGKHNVCLHVMIFVYANIESIIIIVSIAERLMLFF